MPRSPRLEFTMTTKVAACLARIDDPAVLSVVRDERTLAAQLAICLQNLRCPGLIEIHRKCGKPLCSTKTTEFDHIKRNEIQPDNSVSNCRPICPECHKIKTARDAEEAAKGRLIRKETKKSRRPKAKIHSRNTLSKEYRDQVREGRKR